MPGPKPRTIANTSRKRRGTALRQLTRKRRQITGVIRSAGGMTPAPTSRVPKSGSAGRAKRIAGVNTEIAIAKRLAYLLPIVSRMKKTSTVARKGMFRRKPKKLAE